MNGTTRLKIGDLNKNLICVLCGGYLIDATTIIECLHSFCRTCIVTFLKSSRTCPVCDTVVHKTRPHQNIRSDKLLQDLVYKLVPGLYKDEMRRRREFYTSHYEAAPKRAGEERGDEMSDRFTFTEEENISLALYLCPDGGNERFGFHRVFTTKEDLKTRMDKRIKESVDVRYLQCKAAVTVGILKKFLRLKYSLPEYYQIDIFYNDEPLRTCYTLCDIAYIFNWRRRAPLLMTFCVYEGSKLHKKPKENQSCQQTLSPPPLGEAEVKVEPVDIIKPSLTGDITKPNSGLAPVFATTSNESKLIAKVTNEAQKKTSVKISKSKGVPSKSKSCLSNSSTSQFQIEPSCSSCIPEATNNTSSSSSTSSTLLPSTPIIKTNPSKTKSTEGDKRKSLQSPEASSSKKKRKVSQEPPRDLLLPSQPTAVSSSQTLLVASKGDAHFQQTQNRSVTVVRPVVSDGVSPASTNRTSATATSSMSQPMLSSLARSTLPSTVPTLTTSTLTQPMVTCTVTPSRTMPSPSPSLTTTIWNHSQYVSTQTSSSKTIMTPSSRMPHAQITSKLYTSSFFQLTSSQTSSTQTPPQSCIPPITTAPLTPSSQMASTITPSLSMSTLKMPTPKCSQKVKKPNPDFENQGKNRNSSLGKRPASTPVPIAPAPAKLQNYCPSSVEVGRMMKLDPGMYVSVHQNVNTNKQTTVCPTSTSLSVKSAKLVNNKMLTPTTTLKFSVSSLLSPTPGKSSLVSVTHNNKPVSNMLTSNTPPNDAIGKSTPGNLLVQPATKLKVTSQALNVSRSQQSSSQMSSQAPNVTRSQQSSSQMSSQAPNDSRSQQSSSQMSTQSRQSIQSVQNTPAVSFDSTVTVSSQSIASPTPASSASPTPAAVPPQQSQTQGSDIIMITSIKQEPGSAEQKVNPHSLSENTTCNNIIKSNGKTKTTTASATNSIQDKKSSRVPGTGKCEPQNVPLPNDERSTSQSFSPPLTQESCVSSSVPSSGSPEQNGEHKLDALSPTGSNGSACPSRKQACTQKKKIADIANTLLQNQNSKSTQVLNISNTRKNGQNTASNNKQNLPLLNNEFYMGVVNGQSLHSLNKCPGTVRHGGNSESDEPLNLVKKKDVSRLPNGMFILDVPTNIQGHKQLK